MASPAGLPELRRRLRALRLEAALTSTGTALILGLVLVAAAAAYVAGLRGVIEPGAWKLALWAGLPFLGLKVLFDFLDRSSLPDQLRRVLSQSFGAEMSGDSELSRQARMAVEFRGRLAEAEARADGGRRRQVAALILRLDHWLDGIVALAREIAVHRREANFQAGLATRARSRRDEMSARPKDRLAPQTADAVQGLTAQINTAEGYSHYVEAGRLKLESSVAAFGAVSGQLVMALTSTGQAESTAELFRRIGEETGGIESQLLRLTDQSRRDLPPPPAD